MISKSKLADLIEPHFHEFLDEKEYPVVELASEKLLTSNRLDVAIKVLFLEGRELGIHQQERLYREHIRLFTLGTFEEPGNDEKSSADDYIRAFEMLDQDFRVSGFRSDLSLVPIGNAGTILNGAHRLAVSVFHKQRVSCVRIPCADPVYDYRFFLGRGMSVEAVEQAVTRFVELQSNCFVACVWPRAQGFDDQLDKVFPNIVYKREIPLSVAGAHNLLSEVYFGETWLGAAEEGFPGVKGKLIECFTNPSPMRVYVFQADSLVEVQGIKEQIRDLFRVGKHSVHITDSHDEAIRLGRVLFNPNSRHFLEHANPSAFGKTLVQISSLKEDLKKADVSPDDVLIDGSMIMAIYGLREARDIDLLMPDHLGDALPGYESHDSELQYHRIPKADLVYDSRFYFYYRGLKFLALKQLAEMKKNRSEQKDRMDLQVITPLVSTSRLLAAKVLIRGRIAFMRARTFKLIVDFLKNAGLYNSLRRIYRAAKTKKNN